MVPRKRERFSRLPPARVPRPWPHNVGHLRRNRGQHSCRVISLIAVGSSGRRSPLPQPVPLTTYVVEHSLSAAEVRGDPRPIAWTIFEDTGSDQLLLDFGRIGASALSAEEVGGCLITAFIPLSVRVNGAGRSTGCCCGAGLRWGAGLRCGAFGRRDEGVETEASRRSRSRHTSSYSWNKGCSCSSFRSSSRRSRSALIRSVIRYSCSNELKRKLLVARKAACKDRQPSAGAGHLRHFPLHQRDRLLGLFPVTLTGDRGFESLSLQQRVGKLSVPERRMSHLGRQRHAERGNPAPMGWSWPGRLDRS